MKVNNLQRALLQRQLTSIKVDNDEPETAKQIHF